MKVTVHFHGILADWVGVSRAEIELPSGATLADLLSQIRKLFGAHMPARLKEKQDSEFQQAFWAVKGALPVSDPRTIVEDGEEWRFFFPLAGG
jgi:molybdopterin converting factor small subunit